ncbi:hypothetical protein V6N11_054594 [Hibiscus sabdariffa]|uniref:RNase H type-1 domain-containing protein n=1 Tax=Hibiscus sabdariffa TaxID=183260 RepID=A0ABR2S4C7_9ROSI
MPRMCGRACLQPCRISGVVFFLPRTLIWTVTFGDSRVSVLGGLAQHSPGLDSPVFAEAVVVRVGLQFACERGWDKVIL